MKRLKHPVVIFGAFVAIAVGVLLHGIPFASFLRSEEAAFTQLMGYIEKGQSRARVRWVYLDRRASTMRLSTEKPEVWSVRGRLHGEPARLVIRFSGGTVQSVYVEPAT